MMNFRVRYFLCILLLTIIGHTSCHAQATPSATPDSLAAVDALKFAVCLDVDAPETIKNMITETLIRFPQGS